MKGSVTNLLGEGFWSMHWRDQQEILQETFPECEAKEEGNGGWITYHKDKNWWQTVHLYPGGTILIQGGEDQKDRETTILSLLAAISKKLNKPPLSEQNILRTFEDNYVTKLIVTPKENNIPLKKKVVRLRSQKRW